MEEEKTEKTKMENGVESESNPKVLKSKNKAVDRVVLNHKSAKRIGEWISQIEKKEPALRISRSDIANFVLFSHPIELSVEELQDLRLSHHKASRFSKWFDSVVQNATRQGREISPEELLKMFVQCQNGSFPKEV